MNWHSPAEFLAMGGHGLYVWGSYGVALVLMLIEPWLAARRRRRALQDAAAAQVWADVSSPAAAAPVRAPASTPGP